MYRYAWLELDGGMWHFLTHLSADPQQSIRRWSDSRHALAELMKEGWTIVRPYPPNPPNPPKMESGEAAVGYGLTRYC
jgi:hypothetical protein